MLVKVNETEYKEINTELEKGEKELDMKTDDYYINHIIFEDTIEINSEELEQIKESTKHDTEDDDNGEQY